MAYTRSLDAVEVRILGALMEKERTTPDLYPLTVAALLQACNQKTSRDPVSDYSETVVVSALDRLRAVITAPDPVRQKFRALIGKKRIATLAQCRPATYNPVNHAVLIALKTIVRPAVPTVVRTASAVCAPLSSSSRKRDTTNSE